MSCAIGQCQKCSPYTTPLLQKKTPSSLFPSGDRYLATLLASLLSFLSFLPRLHTFTRVSCSYPLLPSSCHPSFLPRPRTLPWCVLLLAILLSSPSFLPRPHTFTLCVLLLVTLLAPSSFLPRPHTFILCVLLLSSHRPLMPFKICEDRCNHTDGGGMGARRGSHKLPG